MKNRLSFLFFPNINRGVDLFYLRHIRTLLGRYVLQEDTFHEDTCLSVYIHGEVIFDMLMNKYLKNIYLYIKLSDCEANYHNVMKKI